MNKTCKYLINRFHRPVTDQRGISLLEVLLSTVIMGLALAGFLMALSTSTVTSKKAVSENQLVFLASLELENLRAVEFNQVPFLQTAAIGHIEEVPNYFTDLTIWAGDDGPLQVRSSGWFSTGAPETEDYDPVTDDPYSMIRAFDGRRANENSRWIGTLNALAYRDDDPGGGGPGGEEPGGGGPVGGGPGEDPGGGGDIAPDDYQYICCAFREPTRIARVLLDNRFNVTEIRGVPEYDFDYLPHEHDIWQRNFDFFWSDKILEDGEPYDPWIHDYNPLDIVKDLGYGSGGVHMVYNKPEVKFELGLLGVHNIDTYADFDRDFHWPFISEIEVYGYDVATNYIEQDNRSVAGEEIISYDNVIMYFPNYLDSGYDMGRRTYVVGTDLDSIRLGQRDLIRVELEFYPASPAAQSEEWQKVTWWRDDGNELAKFRTSFYRGRPTRIDRLPNLRDFPAHLFYEDGEDLRFPFTVPGASEIRGHFGVFDLDETGPDRVWIEDGQGNVIEGPYTGIDLLNRYTLWVPGDTIVVHFVSDPNGGNSFEDSFGGWSMDMIEIRWQGFE